MSGGEALLVLGAISSCISIIDASKKLLNAAQDARGLPETFRAVDAQLPLILNTLQNVESRSRNAGDAECAPVSQAAKKCEQNAALLHKVLQEVMTEEKDGRIKRYHKHIKALGKGHKVEVLAQEILKQLQYLQAQHIFAHVATTDDLQEAISQLENFEEEDGTYNTYGSGSINVAKDNSTQHNHNYSGKFESKGTMHIGPAFYGERPLSATQRCLQSLAFPNHRRRPDIGAKTDGTCDWILQHDEYRKWAQEGGILLIKGGPGTGKSTLMDSILTQDLENTQHLHSEHVVVASFFFYQRGDALQHTALGLYRSLLHQIFCQDQGLLSMFVAKARFEERCENEGEPGPDKRWDWTEPELRDSVKDIMKVFLKDHYLRLYIDALDESSESRAQNLWRFFTDLFRQSMHRLSICISCRHYPDLDFGQDYYIAMENENRRDISAYISAAFQYDSKWQSRADLMEIKYALEDRAVTVFQWAVLVVQRILTMPTESKEFIIMDVDRLPTKLSALYKDILESLVRESTEDGEQALRILRWITFAQRPLTLAELRHAVLEHPEFRSQSTSTTQHCIHRCDNNKTMADRVKRLSRGLAKVVEEENGDQIVQFDHESVKEFMSEGGILLLEQETNQNIEHGSVEGRAHYILCKVCIKHLACSKMHYRRDGPHPFIVDPFLRYCVQNWIKHAKNASDQDHTLGEMLMQLTAWPCNEVCTHWHALSRGWRGNSRITLQHVAAQYGLCSVMELMISRSSETSQGAITGFPCFRSSHADDIDSPDHDGQTPLWKAAARGHDDLVKILLASGRVDVNRTDLSRNTPLHDAARGGHEKVISMLLATSGVSVNAKGFLKRTPMVMAAICGYERVVKQLLDTGEAEVDARDTEGWTPLLAAAHMGHEGVVKLLLDTGGAKPDFMDYDGRTSLFAAATRGHERVVKLLLDTGKVNINTTDVENRTPLLSAATYGHEKVVKLLLDTAEAKVDTIDNENRTPLLAAAQRGHKGVVKLLLDTRKVTVDARDCDGWTPLTIAREFGYKKIVKLLLATGKAEGCGTELSIKSDSAAEEMNQRYHNLLQRRTTIEADPEIRELAPHDPALSHSLRVHIAKRIIEAKKIKEQPARIE